MNLYQKLLLTQAQQVAAVGYPLYEWGLNASGQLGQTDLILRSSPTQLGSNSWTSVSAGLSNTFGIADNKSLYGWGYNTLGVLGTNDQIHRSSPVQINTDAWYQISEGVGFTLGIKNDRTLWGWGTNVSNQLGPNVITTAYSWNQLSIDGSSGKFMIRSDGSLWAWGSNAYGQLGVSDVTYRSSPVQVGTSSWSYIGTGGNATAAIRIDGALFTWGGNASGQLGQGNTITRSSPVQVGTSSWNMIATAGPNLANAGTMYARRIDGTLWGWGDANIGQLGTVLTNKSSPIQLGTSSWSAIAAGNSVLLAIKTDGTLWGLGNNSIGQLGYTLSDPYSWIMMSTGGLSSLGIRNDNTLWSWGTNTDGQLGQSDRINRSSPVQVGTSSWSMVMAAYSKVFAIRSDGGLFAWGLGTGGQLGLNDTLNRSSPVQVGTSSWSSISTNDGNQAIRSDGALFTWGTNVLGNLGLNDTLNRSSPVQVGTSSWVMVSNDGSHTIAIRKDNSLWGWGSNTFGEAAPIGPDTIYSWKSIVVGGQNTTDTTNPVLAIRSDGSLWAWGYNISGQLGLSDSVHRSSPVQIGTSSWSSIAADAFTTAAIRIDGTLWVWGDNTISQLGQGDTINRSSPVQVGTSSWSQVDVGNYTVMAIRNGDRTLWGWGNNTVISAPYNIPVLNTTVTTIPQSWTSVASNSNGSNIRYAIETDGTLWAWGDNITAVPGILGLNDRITRSSPVQVGTSSWTTVSTGGTQTLAIRQDGALFSWGTGPQGLNLPTTTTRSSPVQVGTSSWSAVAANTANFYAIRADGGLFSWGVGTNGDLGLNLPSAAQRSSPVQIGTSSWTAVVTGGTYAHALRIDGTLWAWGGNASGQLGTNNVILRSSPVQIGSSSWTSLTAGIGYQLAIRTDGALFAWGIGAGGVLGLAANVVNRSSPTQVGTSSWSSVGAGGSAAQAVRSDGALFTWGLATNGQTGQDSIISRSSPVQVGTSSWTNAGTWGSAISIDKTLYQWGLGTFGQLGLFDVVTRSSPVQVGNITYPPGSFNSPVQVSATSWMQISVGYDHVAGIQFGNTLFTWGLNQAGQLGLSDRVHRSSPTQVGTLFQWSDVLAGFNKTVAVNNSQLYTIGNNTSGELGTSDVISRSSPTLIGAIGVDYQIGGKGNATYYSRQAPSGLATVLFGFGNNASGQLGLGDLVSRSSPTLVGGDAGTSWTGWGTGMPVGGGGATAAMIQDTTGSLYIWGNNTNGQLGQRDLIRRSSPTLVGGLLTSLVGNVSSPIQIGASSPRANSWTYVAAGPAASFGINQSSLYAWGQNITGQLGIGDSVHRSSPTQVGSSSWISVEGGVGSFTTGATSSSGALFMWGDNLYGQLGIGDSVHRSSPTQVGSSSWTIQSAGAASAAITSDGKLFAWGYNFYGQLGIGIPNLGRSSPVQVGGNATFPTSVSIPMQIGLSSWTSVATNGTLQVATRIDGGLFTWGKNDQGELGLNDTVQRSSPVQVGTSSWSSVASGNNTSGAAAIRADGALFGWGTNTSGKIGNGDLITRSSPVQVGTSSWSQVGVGTVAIRSDGAAFGWSFSWPFNPATSPVQIGNELITTILSPVQIGTNSWKQVAAGDSHAIAIKSDSTLYAWGNNTYGQLGINDSLMRSSPTQVSTSTWTSVAANSNFSMAIDTSNSLYTWGNNSVGQLGVEILTTPYSWTTIDTANGGYMVAAIRSDGTLWSWGVNTNAALGLDDRIHRSSPVQVGTSSWTSVTTGNFNYVFGGAIRQDGALFTWGANNFGRLGITGPSRSSPVQVGTSSWSMIRGNGYITAAIRIDGTLWTWGEGTSGQLGFNDQVHRSSPTQVGTDSWTQVKIGEPFYNGTRYITNVIALRQDGALFAWGDNYMAGLGLSDTIHRSSPTQIGTDSWAMISGGGSTAAAIRSDGALFTWGSNVSGILGQNDIIHRSSPVQVGTSSWTSVSSTGLGLMVAKRIDNSWYQWGNNTYGAYGDNSTISASSPVQIATNSNVFVVAGSYNKYIIYDTGELFSVGYNSYGALGQLDVILRSNPVQIGNTKLLTLQSPTQVGTSSWSSISAGENYALGLLSDKTLFGWGNSDYGQAGFLPGTTQIDYWNSISASTGGDTFVIKNDGTLWGMGFNEQGQLNTGSVSARSSLVQIGTSSWTSVSAGRWDNTAVTMDASAMLAIRQDGALFAWGLARNLGQISTDGSFTSSIDSSSPTQIGSSSWSMVNISDNTSAYLIRNDGALFTWGSNQQGQLGLGDPNHRSSPTQLGTNSWTTVIGGYTYYGATPASNYAIGLRTDGTLWSWGDNTFGYLGTSRYNTPYSWVQISGSFGIRNDNTLWAWGQNNAGMLGLNDQAHRSSPIQVGTSSWSSITTSQSNTIAIRSDGGLFAWGYNAAGQLGSGDIVTRSSPIQVGTSSWAMVSAGGSSVIAIRSDRALFAWGNNNNGQLAQLDSVLRSSPVQVGTSSWSIVASGNGINSAIRQDGGLFAWGNNSIGQTGHNDLVYRSSPVQVGTSSWSLISAGYSYSLAIRSDGGLFAWGMNNGVSGGLARGELGLNDVIHRSSPVQVGTSSWSNVSAGTNALSAAIRSDGVLFVWGDNTSGQLGLNDRIHRSSPVQLGAATWSKIDATSAIKSDGSLFAWGLNVSGQLGLSDRVHRSSPVQIGTDIAYMILSPIQIGASSWTSISAINNTIAAIRSDKTLWAWGNNSTYQLGQNDSVHRSSPVQVTSGSWALAKASKNTIFALSATGNTLWGIGDTSNGQLWNTSVTDTIYSWSSVSSNGNTTYAIRTGGSLWAWGDNFYGELGINDTINRSSPVQVGTSSWSTVSAGNGFSKDAFAIRIDGGLFIWGENQFGQLGQGNTISLSSPTQVGTSSWSFVNGGYNVTAIRSDGALFTWGDNFYGQLGQNLPGSNDRSSPVQVGTSSWTSAGASGYIASAIRIDGTLWAWGDNTLGGLGLSDSLHRSSPVQVGASSWSMVSVAYSNMYAIRTDKALFAWGDNASGYNMGTSVYVEPYSWLAVAGSANSTAAIRSDGTLWTWGLNDSGQLGSSTLLNRSSPVQVGTSSWTAISGGSGSKAFFAKRLDGTLWSWGLNTFGQLGQGNTISRSSPTQVGTSSWAQLSAGTSASAAIRIDGALFTWGVNDTAATGALGLNDTINRSSPVQVGTSSWTLVNAYDQRMIGIRNDGALFAWGQNPNGQLGQNDSLHRSSPIQIGTSSWTMAIISFHASAAIRTDGALFTWGWNVNGALGTNNVISRSSPVQVGTSSWTSVNSKYFSIGAIRSDGSLFIWGFGASGGVGNNSVLNRSSPIQIGTSSWSQVTGIGGAFTMSAIRQDSALFMWGDGSFGSLGNDDIIHRSSPVQVGAYNVRAFPSPTQIGTSSWTSVSAGYEVHSAIRTDGALFAWGYNGFGTISTNDLVHRSSPVQIGTSSWTMTGTTGSGLAIPGILLGDLLYMWGQNGTGSLGLADTVFRSSPVIVGGLVKSYSSSMYNISSDKFTDLSIGVSDYAVLATGPLSTSRPLYVWGNNTYGQLGQNDRIHRSSPTLIGVSYAVNQSSPIQIGTNSWNSISAGTNHSMAIKVDDTLYGWGNNTNLTLGAPQQVTTVYSWIKVSTGANSSIAIRSDGALFTWGAGDSGSLGTGNIINRSSPVQVGTSKWSAIATICYNYTYSHFAIRSDGILFAWGNNGYGQLGLGKINVMIDSPTQVGAGSWSMISSNSANYTIAAITSTNLLFTWGNNTYGQLGFNDQVHRSSPTQVGTSSWSSVNAYSNTIAAIDINGALFTWGENTAGQLGTGDTVSRSSPTQVSSTSSWSNIGVGRNVILAIDRSNSLWGVGNNGTGMLGATLPNSTLYSWKTIPSGGTLGIRSDGLLFNWSSNDYGQVGDNTIITRSSPVQIGTSSWSFVFSSNGTGSATFAIRTDGALFAWGANSNGQLGLDDLSHRSSPVQIGTSSWTVVAGAGESTPTLGIRIDGALFVWGYNLYGQLGLNDTVHRSSPVQVGTSSWSFVATGNFAAAVRSDGRLFTWGNNNTFGLLGLNDTINRSSPTQVGTSSWSQINSNYSMASAVRSDGALFTWGDNLYGQLGLLDKTHRSSPVQLGTSSWTSVNSGGPTMSLALRTDNMLFAWGRNDGGQLGLSDTIHRSSPVQIGTSSWVSTSGYSIAIRSDNLMFGWGNNYFAHTGQNTTVYSSSPTLIGANPVYETTTFVQIGTSSWTSVSAGTNAAAIRSDSALFTWGLNTMGQLGLNDRVHRSSPTQIGTDSWSSVATGIGLLSNDSAMVDAIRSDGALFAWGINSSGNLGQNDQVHRSSPVQVGGQDTSALPIPYQIGTSSWAQVSAGKSFTAALRK